MSISNDKEHVTQDTFNRLIAVGALFIVIVGIIVTVVGMYKDTRVAPKNAHYYTDVAEWVQDVQSHVPDSEKRHTFVASVYAFVADNKIDDKEYDIISESYKDLKQSIALNSIHNNLKLMRDRNEFSLIEHPYPPTSDIN